MWVSALLNLEAVSMNPSRWYGLVTDLRVKNNQLSCFVIKKGSRFTPSVFFLPEAIVRVEEEYIQVCSEHSLMRLPQKDFEAGQTDSLSLIGLPVVDKYNVQFGKVTDAFFTRELKITQYVLSRSFFDDVDFGFVIIDAEDLQADMEQRRLCYNQSRDDLPENPRQSGLMRKIFGIREDNR
jgi:hypothetical protein